VGVDCKFLNFGVHIAKSLKLHGLKVNFPLQVNSQRVGILGHKVIESREDNTCVRAGG
jgi:hypothetical protein